MVMAIIYLMGTVSGAHLNPAVTIAFAVRRKFPWRRVPGYILGQIAGGIAAAIFLRAMFGTAGELGATEPGAGVSDLQALLMEVLLTAGLVNTVLGHKRRA
jgi:aquaporin Z